MLVCNFQEFIVGVCQNLSVRLFSGIAQWLCSCASMQFPRIYSGDMSKFDDFEKTSHKAVNIFIFEI